MCTRKVALVYTAIIDAIKLFLLEVDNSCEIYMNVRQYMVLNFHFYLFPRCVFATTDLDHWRETCRSAARAHLNFNLAKGGRQQEKKSREIQSTEGQVSNKSNQSEMRVICLSLRVDPFN